MSRAIAAVVLSLAAVSAFAQYKDCNPPATQGQRHILVDDFRFSDEAGASTPMKQLRDELVDNIRGQIDAIQLMNVPSLKTTPCPGRFPQPGDFTRPRVESMDNRDVVMELWTEIRPSDPQHFDAEFNFVVVPAFRLNLAGVNTSCLFTVRYPLTANQRREQILVLLRSHPELAGYALIGAGLRAVENKDYDYAAAYLCRGAGELLRVPATTENQKLLNYVERAKSKVISDARANNNYNGTLRLAGAETKCVR